MNNTKSIYRPTLMSGMALIVVILCGVTFIGCPEAEEMTDDVITPSADDVPPPRPQEEDVPPPRPQEEDVPPPRPQEEDVPPPAEGAPL